MAKTQEKSGNQQRGYGDGRKRRIDAIICVIVFVVVFAGQRSGVYTRVYDTRWYVPTALSIVREGNANLDEYRDIITDDDYAIERIDGHLYHFFPIGTAIVATPFVFVLDKLAQIAPLGLTEYAPQPTSWKPEYFISCFITSLNAIFIYLLARLFLDRLRSLALVFVFAFCTSAWSVASRALWQHGPSMLALTLSLYMLLLAGRRPRLVMFVSIPLFFSYLIRPTNSISIAMISVFVFMKYRRYSVYYLMFGCLPFLALFIYSYPIYHSILPSYYVSSRIYFHKNIFKASLGNLISPARGLFIFSPILAVSIYSIFSKIKSHKFESLDCILVVIIIIHWMSISAFPHWWGGHSFGPRLFSDMIPYFIYFLIPVLEAIPDMATMSRAFLSSVFCLFVLISFLIHARGALVWAVHEWNRFPVNVNEKPERLWNWHDIQFLRGIQVMTMEPVRLPLPRWTTWFVPNKADFVFDDMFALKGYELRVDPDNCYQALVVLYWQARQRPDFDYSVFVHLIDGEGHMVAQQDHAPGASMGYPPTGWRIRDLISDEHIISIPSQVAAGTYRFKVGVYNWATGERMKVSAKGMAVGRSVMLDQTIRLPRPQLPRSYMPIIANGHP